ncbi:hypothetical protein TUMEXPCC7403_03895 [Tumidithrix helvetica PCC 7403]
MLTLLLAIGLKLFSNLYYLTNFIQISTIAKSPAPLIPSLKQDELA